MLQCGTRSDQVESTAEKSLRQNSRLPNANDQHSLFDAAYANNGHFCLLSTLDYS